MKYFFALPLIQIILSYQSYETIEIQLFLFFVHIDHLEKHVQKIQ